MGDMKWYVLRTAGSKEKKAKDYLEKEIERFGLQDQVAQVLVPVKREIVTKNGKKSGRKAALSRLCLDSGSALSGIGVHYPQRHSWHVRFPD